MLERLAGSLALRRRFTQARPRQAAILLPLLQTGTGLELLLTRRSAAMSSHPGQVAFPGGVTEYVRTWEIAHTLAHTTSP